jgi:hypothetical protein
MSAESASCADLRNWMKVYGGFFLEKTLVAHQNKEVLPDGITITEETTNEPSDMCSCCMFTNGGSVHPFAKTRMFILVKHVCGGSIYICNPCALSCSILASAD